MGQTVPASAGVAWETSSALIPPVSATVMNHFSRISMLPDPWNGTAMVCKYCQGRPVSSVRKNDHWKLRPITARARRGGFVTRVLSLPAEVLFILHSPQGLGRAQNLHTKGPGGGLTVEQVTWQVG